MKALAPDPRQNWPSEGKGIWIGEFRREWISKLTGPRAAELIATYRAKVDGRYVISGQMVGGIRRLALLHFRGQFVRFTVIVAGKSNEQPLVEQLGIDEFFRRFGLAQVKNVYNNDFALEATLVVEAALYQGNRGKTKFQLGNVDETLTWLGMEDCAQTIERLR